MNRSSKMRSSNYYSNSQLQAPGGNVGEVQHRSIEQSFTEDDGDSEAEPAFKTKNTFYELQSKCNNLEYEKIKSEMAYKNIVSELRSKNAYLEQLASTHAYNNQILADERDKVLTILSEVREQNYELAKQIEGFKREVSKLEHSRGQAEELDQTHLLSELQQKQDEIGAKDKKIAMLENQLGKLEMQNQAIPNESASILKRQINSLEKELQAVKVELDAAQKTQDSLRAYQRQKQQLSRQIKIKDHQIAELKQAKEKIEQEVERTKANADAREKKTAISHSEQVKRLTLIIKTKQELLQEHENNNIAMESKITELTVEAGRLRSQNNGLEQYNKYLQSVNAENELKRKSFQEELYKSQREISQLRTSLFNQKLENKKSLSNMRLTFQQQKIRHVQLLDEKSKEITKLRELSISSNRHNAGHEQASSRNQGLMKDLQMTSQMVSQLKSQNQALKQELKALESKYEKKHQKFIKLEKQLKAEYQKRIKSLENQIYKLQLQPETKKDKANPSKNGNFFLPMDYMDDDSLVMQQIKPQNIQELQRQKKTIQKQEKYVQKLKKQEQTIKRLQSQLWQYKDSHSRNIHTKSDIEERMRIINQLQSEISRLNSELRKQRDNSSQLRRQVSMTEQKLILQLKKSQEQIENLNRSNKQMAILQKDTNRLESELKMRQNEAQRREFQIESLKLERENKQRHQKDLEAQLQSFKNTQRGLQSKVKELQQKLKQSKNMQASKDKQPPAQPLNILMKKCEQLERQNKQIKMDYTKTLVSHQNLQGRYTKLLMKNEQLKNELLSSKQKANPSHLLKQIDEYKITTANYKSQIQHLNKLLIQRPRSISPQDRSTIQQKERRKTKETQLWLNSKPQHDYERNNHSAIIVNRKKNDHSYIQGDRSYKY